MFRTLTYVKEVYETRSFSRAAKNLFISQPSLSLTIKKFENDIGIIIFDRSTNPIRLTEAGKVYIDGIIRILDIVNDLKNYVDDYNDLEVGKLTIGAPHTFSNHLVPSLIAQFHKKFPHIEIKLVEADLLSSQDLLLRGDIDLVIESNEFDENLYNNHRIFIEQILIAVPITDPVNITLKEYSLTREDIINGKHLNESFPSVPIQYLSNSNFLLLEKGHDMYNRANKLLQEGGFEPKVFMTLKQLTATFSMTNQQLGISFVSDTIVKLIDYKQNILYYKIDEELSIRYINLAYKRNRYVSKAMHEFINLILRNDYEGLRKADI